MFAGNLQELAMTREFWLASIALGMIGLAGCGRSTVDSEIAASGTSLNADAIAVQAAVGSTVNFVSAQVPPAIDFNPFVPTKEAAKPVTAHRPLRKLAPAAEARPPEPVAADVKAPPLSLADLIEKVEPSVVRIKVNTNLGDAIGSGFVASPDGTLVVTNYHVIEGGFRAEVGFRDNVAVHVAGVRSFNVKRDLAVIQIAGQDPRRAPLTVAAALPRKGETVIALGSPRGFSFTASDGIVSGIRGGRELREIIGAAYDNDLNMNFIQTTTPISPGNSGGPLVNLQGDVVGINTFCRTDSQNLNFAVAAEHVREILNMAQSAPLIPLTSLPRASREVVQRGEAVQGWDVKLPNGKVFSSSMCSFSQGQYKAARNFAKMPAVVEFSTGQPKAVAFHTSGTLNGTAILVNESRRPKLVCNYDDGKLHGNLIVGGDDGDVQLFAQYVRGNLDGYHCQFKGNAPWLLAEYSKDKLTGLHLITGLQVTKSFKAAEEIGQQDPEAASALTAMNKSVNDLSEMDRSLRKSVREIDQEDRRARASDKSAESVQFQAIRNAQRVAKLRAFFTALIQQAGEQ